MPVMRIKELREAADMKQIQLAACLGVSQNTVSGWELEISLPKARDLPRLAKVLACSVDDLYAEHYLVEAQSEKGG